MKTEIRRWGNSLALRIPRAFAMETLLAEGAAVDVAVTRGRLVVTPLKTKYRLDDLVGKIKPSHRHQEQFTDGPSGREIW